MGYQSSYAYSSHPLLNGAQYSCLIRKKVFVLSVVVDPLMKMFLIINVNTYSDYPYCLTPLLLNTHTENVGIALCLGNEKLQSRMREIFKT